MQGITGDYKGIQGITRVYRGLQGYTRVFRELQEYTKVYKELQENARVYREVQGYIKGFIRCKQNQFDSKAGTTASAIETLMGQYFD